MNRRICNLFLIVFLLSSSVSVAQATTSSASPHSQMGNCYTGIALLQNDQWGGHFNIYWPANWSTDSTNPVKLAGNFNGAQLLVTNREGSQQARIWIEKPDGSIVPYSILDATWQTITDDTQHIWVNTHQPAGGGQFDLMFCSQTLPVPVAPSLPNQYCYWASAVFQNDQWGGHYNIPWRSAYPVDSTNPNMLKGNYKDAIYRVTNRQGSQQARLWIQTPDGNSFPTSVPNNSWQAISNNTQRIWVNTHQPAGGNTFDFEICFKTILTDITNTPEGQQRATEAVDRWQTKFGITVQQQLVHVFESGTQESPELLVSIDGLTPDFVWQQLDVDLVNEEFRLTAGAEYPLVIPLQVDPEGSGEKDWHQLTAGCFSRLELIDGTNREVGWMEDHCAKIHWLMYDGSTARDYYILEQFAAAQSVAPFTLKEIALASSVYTGADATEQHWEDWNPKMPEDRGDCYYVELGVQAGGEIFSAGLVGGRQICERHIPDRHSIPGEMIVTWSGNTIGQERYAGSTIAVVVDQATQPVSQKIGWRVLGKFAATYPFPND